jgi:magnesium-transporting ATPase (P-type)
VKAAASYEITLKSREGTTYVRCCLCADCDTGVPRVSRAAVVVWRRRCCPCCAASITVSVLGRDERYDIEHEFEFTSERKRMSVVARNLDTGRCVSRCL